MFMYVIAAALFGGATCVLVAGALVAAGQADKMLESLDPVAGSVPHLYGHG